MNVNFKSSRRIASMLLLSLGLASGASAQNPPPPQLLQQIEAAHTRVDYEALATYYEGQAAAARAVAVEHLKMAKNYQGMIAGGRGGASMPAHCKAIASKSQGLAVDYEGMAVAYRQLAQQTKP